MFRSLKLPVYRMAERVGFFSVVANSTWRRKRLAILCYHGVALDDEHRWDPGLYVTDSHLGARLETLRRAGCRVLRLEEAVEGLRNGTLPPRSVVLTFDDGYYDFYRKAVPVLREYNAPATVFVSSYYAFFNRPVFDPMLAYLLWKGAGQTLSWPEVLGDPVPLTPENRAVVWRRLSKYAAESNLPATGKDALLGELASRLGIDYEEICSRRLLHFMNPDELRSVATEGFDIQLHTHRHRIYREKEPFMREIEENRSSLHRATGGKFRHFCYPSGVYYNESGETLRECGVVSATTSDPGLASPSSDPHYLPRFCDATNTPDIVFTAWTSGAASLLPHRRRPHL